MLYKDFLKTRTGCPFCEPVVNRVIKEDTFAFLTYALAPYHKHHLLVIPHRHSDNFQDLTAVETESINTLLRIGVDILTQLGYTDYTILVRNGGSTAKSIEHLHYHIVPSVIIGDLDHKGEERVVMTDDEINQLMGDIKKALV